MFVANNLNGRAVQNRVRAGRVALALLLALGLTSLTPAANFTIEQIATVQRARELAFAPNGDLFAGTNGDSVYLIPNADTSPGSPVEYASPGDAPAAGVAFASGTLYIGTQHAIWRVAYRAGMRKAGQAPTAIAHVRGGEPPAGSDGDVHSTTSVAAAGSHVYASVGSSCNACVETDSSRATVGEIRDGRYVPFAKRIRNAIGLAVDESGRLWVTDAGQDELPTPHPYEFIDDAGARGQADYGWPYCFENHKQKPGTHENCSSVAIPQVIFPAYETPIAAVFYPSSPRGRYAFPARYRGGIFVTLHGSWHGTAQGLSGNLPPRVVFVAMRNSQPIHAPDWSNPGTQWSDFITGYQQGGDPSTRVGRPTGIAVGPQGDLFIADDQSGAIYRVRPRV